MALVSEACLERDISDVLTRAKLVPRSIEAVHEPIGVRRHTVALDESP